MAQKTATYIGAGISSGTFGGSSNAARLTNTQFGAVASVSDVAYSYAAADNTCIVTRLIGGSIVAGSTITFNNVVYDPRSMYNNGTGGIGGTAAIVIPTTGFWNVAFGVARSAGAPNFTCLLNGVTALMQSGLPVNLADSTASGSFFLNVGDALSIVANNITGFLTDANRTYFTVSRSS